MGGQTQEEGEKGTEDPEGIWAEEPSSFLVRGESAELQEKGGVRGCLRDVGEGWSVAWPGPGDDFIGIYPHSFLSRQP